MTPTDYDMQRRLLKACSKLVGKGVDANRIYVTLLDTYAPVIDDAPRSYRDVHPLAREDFMREFEALVEKAIAI